VRHDSTRDGIEISELIVASGDQALEGKSGEDGSGGLLDRAVSSAVILETTEATEGSVSFLFAGGSGEGLILTSRAEVRWREVVGFEPDFRDLGLFLVMRTMLNHGS